MAAHVQPAEVLGADLEDAPARLVVRYTFLDYIGDEEAPPQGRIERARTDSVLYTPDRTAALVEYRPGSPASTSASARETSSVSDGRRSGAGDSGTDAVDSGTDAVEEQGAQGRPPCAHEDTRTTLMMRNLPNDYTRGMLLGLLDNAGFAGAYDFVYLPVDFTRGCGLGYAFVNLVDVSHVRDFRAKFDGYSKWGVRTSKICQVSWSDRDQGLKANTKRYQNSPVMHPSVPDEFRPCLFRAGVRVPFPAPTKQLRRPTTRKA